MIDLLMPFDHICVSKMMLNVLPYMISSDEPLIQNFFDSCIFKPVLIEDALMVQWPTDEDEFIYAAPSSLITEESLEEVLYENHFISKKSETAIESEISINSTTSEREG